MIPIAVDGTLTSCGHALENGSPSLKIDGVPVALVGQSLAGGGVVLGPGFPSIKVDGLSVCILGDNIAPHPPTDKPPHAVSVVLDSGVPVYAG